VRAALVLVARERRAPQLLQSRRQTVALALELAEVRQARAQPGCRGTRLL